MLRVDLAIDDEMEDLRAEWSASVELRFRLCRYEKLSGQNNELLPARMVKVPDKE